MQALPALDRAAMTFPISQGSAGQDSSPEAEPEFVAWAKAGNREVNMASQGIGSVGHMMAERFHLRAGFRRVLVP